MNKLIVGLVLVSAVFASEVVSSEVYKDSEIRLVVERIKQEPVIKEVIREVVNNDLVNELQGKNDSLADENSKLSNDNTNLTYNLLKVSQSLESSKKEVDAQIANQKPHNCEDSRQWWDHWFVTFPAGLLLGLVIR